MIIDLAAIIELSARLAAIGGGAILLWWALRRPRARRAHACCGGCGYEINGLAGGRCPECGGDFLKVGLRGRRVTLGPSAMLTLALLAWGVLLVAALPWVWRALDVAATSAIAPTTLQDRSDQRLVLKPRGVRNELQVERRRLTTNDGTALRQWFTLTAVDQNGNPIHSDRIALPPDGPDAERACAEVLQRLGLAEDETPPATADLLAWLTRASPAGGLPLGRDPQADAPKQIIRLQSAQTTSTIVTSSPVAYLALNRTAVAINVRWVVLLLIFAAGAAIVWRIWHARTARQGLPTPTTSSPQTDPQPGVPAPPPG